MLSAYPLTYTYLFSVVSSSKLRLQTPVTSKHVGKAGDGVGAKIDFSLTSLSRRHFIFSLITSSVTY